MDFLYNRSRSEVVAFGKHWCGRGQLPHATDTLIARYPKKPADGDGQSVEVYCSAWPARFYTLVVAPDPNSLGEPQDGFEVRTGSGQHQMVALIAEAIAEGMLGFYAPKQEPRLLRWWKYAKRILEPSQ